MGGTPTHFFRADFFCHHLHYWVGVPCAYKTDLRGCKQKKKKIAPKKIGKKKGGGGPRPIRPPWIRHWILHSLGRCALQALSEMSAAAQPCNCLCTCNAWLHNASYTVSYNASSSPRKVCDWLIPFAASGLPVKPHFWRLPFWIRGVRTVSSWLPVE